MSINLQFLKNKLFFERNKCMIIFNVRMYLIIIFQIGYYYIRELEYDGAELWATFPSSKYSLDIKFQNTKTKKSWVFFKVYMEFRRIQFLRRKMKPNSNKKKL